MNGFFALLGSLIGLVFQANKKFGRVESRGIYYTHIFLMVVFVFMTGLSMKFLFQLILNFDSTMKIVYIQNGYFSPMINLVVWIASTIVNISALFMTFGIAMRSEKARKLLIITIPLLFVIGVITGGNEMILKASEDISIQIIVISTIIGMLVSYAPIFFFYINKSVKEAIFERDKNEI